MKLDGILTPTPWIFQPIKRQIPNHFCATFLQFSATFPCFCAWWIHIHDHESAKTTVGLSWSWFIFLWIHNKRNPQQTQPDFEPHRIRVSWPTFVEVTSRCVLHSDDEYEHGLTVPKAGNTLGVIRPLLGNFLEKKRSSSLIKSSLGRACFFLGNGCSMLDVIRP